MAEPSPAPLLKFFVGINDAGEYCFATTNPRAIYIVPADQLKHIERVAWIKRDEKTAASEPEPGKFARWLATGAETTVPVEDLPKVESMDAARLGVLREIRRRISLAKTASGIV